jgi:soluble P-type ATPase
VTIRREIPGAKALELDHLLLDVNGTIANRAHLIEGVEDRIGRIRNQLEVHLLSADTLHNLDDTAARLGVAATRVTNGTEKRDYAVELGSERCAAVGNGVNDVPMLEAVRLGIVVVGPEGAGGPTVRAADVVCVSILDALDLLLEDDTTKSTLRP